MAVERTDLERWLREMDAADLKLIDKVVEHLPTTLYSSLGRHIAGRPVFDPVTLERVGQVVLFLDGGELLVKWKASIDESPACRRALMYAVRRAGAQYARWRRAKRTGRGGLPAVQELALVGEILA